MIDTDDRQLTMKNIGFISCVFIMLRKALFQDPIFCTKCKRGRDVTSIYVEGCVRGPALRE